MASQTAPVISETGITAPSYAEILAYLKDQYRAIFGADVYLEADSQDGQFIAIIASAINDSNAAAIACYNAFSPATAQGNGLSSVVKINGLARAVATHSTVTVRLVGVAGTTITNGIVADDNENQWLLPASVTIPPAGEITVTATAKDAGALAAAIGTITKIKTPTYGWQTVSNTSAATPGAPVETDAALRVRQGRSVALPSLTVLEGIVGAVESVTGVARCKAYENDTNATDANGLPAHSIALVVQGGDSAAIAAAIMAKKTPGTYTHGSTAVVVNDDVGVPHTIRYSSPTLRPITVAITLSALAGYTSAIAAQIKQSVADYINALAIGDDVLLPRLYVPAQLAGGNGSTTYRITNIQIAADGGAVGSSDIAIAFNELATGAVANISITVA